MRRVVLGQTGVETSRLGFGCVQLTSRSQQFAMYMLEQALALGITHFDVARSYGFGRAEGILGRFLRSQRSRITVATKFGIEPPSGLAGDRRVINLAKRVLGPFPRLLRRARQHGAGLVRAGAFSPAAAVRSLETSLRELGTDYVDILLLHEATVADAASQPLVEALQGQVAKGTVRCLGIASACGKVGGKVNLLPAAYQVLQFDDNAMSRNYQKLNHGDGYACITHSIFVPATPLREASAAHPHITQRFSGLMNLDLANPRAIGSLLLHYALWSNPGGVVLFSSSDPTRLAVNVQDAAEPIFDASQLSRFTEFVDAVLQAQSHATGAASPSSELQAL